MDMSAQHKVLLVDEDAEFVRSAKELLEARGYDVISATTGESGFQKILKERPDMLVLDVAVAGKTPDFDAAQPAPATMELRTMPVLLVAAASRPGAALEADKTWLPVGSVLNKPIDPAAFVAAVGGLLRRRREMSQNLGILNTVKDMLSGKEDALWTVGPDASVRQAAEIMERYRVRALPVVEKGKLLGIVTDRDLVRKVILEDKPSATTLVRDIMTTKLICVSPNQSLDECMSIITHKRIRHLPVMDGDKLLGIISVGDVVRMVMESKNLAIEQLSTYITSG
jgi:predicted transcriptional regulator/CheY-like chemotaxis protein